MNLGKVDENSQEDLASAEILRAFGHAIGLLPEHQNANATIDWDKDYIYQNLTSYLDKEAVDRQFFTTYIFPFNKECDPESVMLFSFPDEYTLGDTVLEENPTLSDGDKAFIAQLYPGR